jgi:hypothetical protein
MDYAFFRQFEEANIGVFGLNDCLTKKKGGHELKDDKGLPAFIEKPNMILAICPFKTRYESLAFSTLVVPTLQAGSSKELPLAPQQVQVWTFLLSERPF